MSSNRLPRYKIARITDNPAGLCPCGTPGCLCDVVVSTPSPIVKNKIGLLFGNLALKEIGATHVSAGNILEFSRVLFGCSERYAKLERDGTPIADTAERMRAMRARRRGEGNETPWMRLAPDVRAILVDGYKYGIPWEDAEACLPTLDARDYEYIKMSYKNRLDRFGPKTERQGDRVMPRCTQTNEESMSDSPTSKHSCNAPNS